MIDMNAIKGMAREPSTTIGLTLIALAVEDFQSGITPQGVIKFIGGVAGVLLREGAAAAPPATGSSSTSLEVSASVKTSKETNNGNTNG